MKVGQLEIVLNKFALLDEIPRRSALKLGCRLSGGRIFSFILGFGRFCEAVPMQTANCSPGQAPNTKAGRFVALTSIPELCRNSSSLPTEGPDKQT
jgi:hypothetical protein